MTGSKWLLYNEFGVYLPFQTKNQIKISLSSLLELHRTVNFILTHLPLDKMTAISQTIFSDAYMASHSLVNIDADKDLLPVAPFINMV